MDTLRPCPNRPNCVSSQATDPRHAIEPLRFQGSAATAWSRLTAVLRSLPRASIATQTDRYLHVQTRSRIFRFIDDLEFVLTEDESVIHVRSASRLGYRDMGVNRRRVEQIRAAFEDD